MALLNGKFDGLAPFEGEFDHRIPTDDVVLLDAGVFEKIGIFMSHAALHTGIAFVGLSKSVIEFLCLKEVTRDTSLSITSNDVSDIYVREAVEHVSAWL